jgi:FdrA protein
MTDHVEIRKRTYHDSVRLMQASAAVGATPGVGTALIAMGTDLNLELLSDLSFSIPDDTSPDDMIVAIRAQDADVVRAALDALESALQATPQEPGGALEAPIPRIVSHAASHSGANLALISVPGDYAYVEAADALQAGLHVMIFSDNVRMEQEIDLKRQGAERDLLVMGPDCGTAIVGGVGLGFANAVTPGPVGIAGASGTGIQQVCCLLDDAGVGIRHALGTGSRDLSSEVGGASTLQALAALDRDPGTEVIVVVSKPPAPEVADKIRAAAAACATPTVFSLIGQETLETGVASALEALGIDPPDARSWPGPTRHRPGSLLGLFSGGTLRDEARMVVEEELGATAAGFEMLDLGDDEYTRGRPHPMIDQRIRLEHITAAGMNTDIGLLLIDLVLGHGSHPDPSSELAPVVAGVVDAGVAVTVSLCGTAADPQGRDRQAAALHEAGASVFLSNAAAARYAAGLVKP